MFKVENQVFSYWNKSICDAPTHRDIIRIIYKGTMCSKLLNEIETSASSTSKVSKVR